MFQRKDGIVDFDKDWCIGCKACIAACPYDAIFINPEDHTAEKCNMCAHRLEVGLEPACVVVCPTQAILVGDMNDPASKVAGIINREVVAVRRPEKDTRPKLFYKGAHAATLDPLAARRPAGGIFMWGEQVGRLSGKVTSGTPDRSTSSAAAILSYDIPHNRPWDWRVSAYTWTKSISTGAYMVGYFALTNIYSADAPILRFGVPAVAAFFLAITGLLLIADLKQPKRFYYMFLRPQWNSWLVRGGVLISAFGAVLGLQIFMGVLGGGGTSAALAWAGIPLALGTAVYTAYLFAQAKARDLWQNPLLPPHFIIQALVAGVCIWNLAASWTAVSFPRAVSLFTAIHLAMIFGELTMTHGTAHARMAAREITHGEFRGYFRIAIGLSVIGLLTPWVGAIGAACSLFGLLAWEHAHVQAGQSVPLA